MKLKLLILEKSIPDNKFGASRVRIVNAETGEQLEMVNSYDLYFGYSETHILRIDIREPAIEIVKSFK
jgi:hypothetical protein